MDEHRRGRHLPHPRSHRPPRRRRPGRANRRMGQRPPLPRPRHPLPMPPHHHRTDVGVDSMPALSAEPNPGSRGYTTPMGLARAFPGDLGHGREQRNPRSAGRAGLLRGTRARTLGRGRCCHSYPDSCTLGMPTPASCREVACLNAETPPRRLDNLTVKSGRTRDARGWRAVARQRERGSDLRAPRERALRRVARGRV